jgi:hypothetical protein
LSVIFEKKVSLVESSSPVELKKTSTQLKREKVKRLQNQRKYDDYFEIE